MSVCFFVHTMKIIGSDHNLDTIDFHWMDKIIHIIQNNFFYATQKKESHTGLKQQKDKKNKSELIIFWRTILLNCCIILQECYHESTLKPKSVIPLILLLLGFC